MSLIVDAEGWSPAACHCRTVRFRVRLSEGLASARRCDCSLCRMRGAVTVTAGLDGVEALEGAGALTEYRFNTGVARLLLRVIAAVFLFAAIVWADASQACVPWRPKIYFQPGTVHLLDEQGATLEGVASTMERMPTAKLVLISHTEVQLDEPRSEEIAASRAKIIVEELIGRGVSPHRISTRPEGSGGDRDTLDVAMSNYVWFIFTDSAGAPLTCSVT